MLEVNNHNNIQEIPIPEEYRNIVSIRKLSGKKGIGTYAIRTPNTKYFNKIITSIIYNRVLRLDHLPPRKYNTMSVGSKFIYYYLNIYTNESNANVNSACYHFDDISIIDALHVFTKYLRWDKYRLFTADVINNRLFTADVINMCWWKSAMFFRKKAIIVIER